MGNLPTSRTITLSPADPWPSSLGNELQDKIIARSAKTYWRQFHLITTPSWSATNSLATVGGIARMARTTAGPVADARAIVPMEEGDILTGIRLYAASAIAATPTFSGQVVQAAGFTASDFPMFTWSVTLNNTGWSTVVGVATVNVPPAIQAGFPTVISVTTTNNTHLAEMAEVQIKRL